MDSSSGGPLNEQKSLHETLGGGTFADVVLWRRKDVAFWISTATIAAWIVFEKSGYTLLSLTANVLLLLIIIFFLWAKAAATLNRPPPPLPELHVTEEMSKKAAVLLHSYINRLVSVSADICLGKDSKLYFKVAAYLLIIAIIGGIADLVTLAYSSLLIVLTIPVLYEKYQFDLDMCAETGYLTVQKTYARIYAECLSINRERILEKIKLS